MAFLELALDYAARGLCVLPLKPRDKYPIVSGGCHAASADESQIRTWWTKTPNANIGVGCGNSNKAVLDIDHGLDSLEDFQTWRMRNNIPETYSVRTGRRPEFGIQMYFEGAMPDVGEWKLDGCSGQVKSLGGLVVAAGSIHPSGETYQVICDLPFAPTPDVVRSLKTDRPVVERKPGEKITENRNNALCSAVNKFRHALPGVSLDKTLAYFQQWNLEDVAEPLSLDEVEEVVRKQFRLYADAEVLPEVVFSGSQPKPVIDWRERYLTFERVRDAKPVEFLIEGFLALDSITAIAAPVGQRKSLIAMNVAHALCTGEPLFDYFKVIKQPSRVVYLCPEMGISSFSMRLKQIGLDSHVGGTLFCQTMDEDSVKLAELNEELPGAVVIIDTMTRFVDGDQNSPEDMSRFAKVIFNLRRNGATVVLLHHSTKGASNALTLDSAMRGSTEIAAFVTCCWATRLLDPNDPYNSPSLIVNVKQRDFESKPFEATSDKSCRMRIVGKPGQVAELLSKADADAKTVLESILDEYPEMGINKLQEALRAAGHRKGVKWVTKIRGAILGTGVTVAA
jgi:putative DNA primase/helicase